MNQQTVAGSKTPLLDKWNNNVGNRQWLAELLTEYRMIELIAVLREQGIPTPANILALEGSAKAIDKKMALTSAQNMGYHEALNNLHTLSELAAPIKPLTHGGWRGPTLIAESPGSPDPA